MMVKAVKTMPESENIIEKYLEKISDFIEKIRSRVSKKIDGLSKREDSIGKTARFIKANTAISIALLIILLSCLFISIGLWRGRSSGKIMKYINNGYTLYYNGKVVEYDDFLRYNVMSNFDYEIDKENGIIIIHSRK